MPRVASYLIAVVLLGVLVAACGGGEDGEPTASAGDTPAAPTTPADETPGAVASPAEGTPGAAPVSIALWHSEVVSNHEALKGLVNRFNASQDEVRVSETFQGTYPEATNKIVTSLGTGNLPAVLFMDPGQMQRLIDSGAVMPVQGFIDREDYDLSDLDERTVGYYTIEDTLWAMPFALEMSLLYYNKTLFRAAGLDPEQPPRDLEELREYSEAIYKEEGGEVARTGIAIDIKPWLAAVLDGHGDLYVDNANGHDGRATKVLFDNDSGRWFFQWWHDMIDEGLAINVGRNPEMIEGFLAMASNRAAMTFSYAGALRSVIDAVEAGAGEDVELGISPMPGVPGSEGLSASVYGFWIISQRPDEEQEAAWKFIKWLTEPEQQAEWFAGSGYLPAVPSAADLPAAQDTLERYPLFQIPLDAYLSTPPTPDWGIILGPGEEVTQVVLEAVEQMLLAGKDPIDALEEAAAQADDVIENYNRRVGD